MYSTCKKKNDKKNNNRGPIAHVSVTIYFEYDPSPFLLFCSSERVSLADARDARFPGAGVIQEVIRVVRGYPLLFLVGLAKHPPTVNVRRVTLY